MLGLVTFLAMTAAQDSSGTEANVVNEKALALVRGSQQTTATYAVFSWNDVPDGQEIKDGWSAEFHRGDLHRVETPMSRSVADCRKRTGTRVDLRTGKVISNYTVANAACGINTNFPFLAAQWLGRGQSQYGEVDRLRLTDAHTIRTYEVLDNGATVSAVYVDRQGKPLVTAWATDVSDSVPDDIFSEESLSTSFVPEKYKSPPKTRERG
jgi:hypothetical protein